MPAGVPLPSLGDLLADLAIEVWCEGVQPPHGSRAAHMVERFVINGLTICKDYYRLAAEENREPWLSIEHEEERRRIETQG